jgi:hypothetical protein
LSFGVVRDVEEINVRKGWREGRKDVVDEETKEAIHH